MLPKRHAVRGRGRLLLFFVALPLLLERLAGAQVLAADAKLSPELRALSDRLADVQRALRRDFAVNQIFVGGGSSRAILDNLYFDRPLEARDIDLFVVANRKVTPALMRRVAERLQLAWQGQQLKGGVEARPRGNPELPPNESAHYNAGYGIFLHQPSGEVLDLSFYHSRADLRLNGGLNIDTVMLPLRSGQTLVGLAERLRGKSYAQATRQGVVVDEYQGYRGWQSNRLKVAHPAELASKPALWTIRAARSYGKATYNKLPRNVVKLLREGDAKAQTRPSTKLVSRYMERLLKDQHAEAELGMVREVGVLQRHEGARRLLGPSQRWTVKGLTERLAAKGARPTTKPTGGLHASRTH